MCLHRTLYVAGTRSVVRGPVRKLWGTSRKELGVRDAERLIVRVMTLTRPVIATGGPLYLKQKRLRNLDHGVPSGVGWDVQLGPMDVINIHSAFH